VVHALFLPETLLSTAAANASWEVLLTLLSVAVGSVGALRLGTRWWSSVLRFLTIFFHPPRTESRIFGCEVVKVVDEGAGVSSSFQSKALISRGGGSRGSSGRVEEAEERESEVVDQEVCEVGGVREGSWLNDGR
jgi:hypothetical protein